MRTHLIRLVTSATFALCLLSGTAMAQGKGHDKDKGKEKDKGGKEHEDRDRDKHEQRSNGDVNRTVIVDNRAVVRRVPPGLAKKGGLPPGQAKKYYRATDGVVVLRDVFVRNGYTVVRTQPYGTSQYVYYRQGNGLVQRAIIVPGNDRLSFQNVPQLLLQEVLARLY